MIVVIVIAGAIVCILANDLWKAWRATEWHGAPKQGDESSE